ncbi:MAG: hypothetical protein NPIRA03_38380 [Nitrospirales bacterium]|nr:MAG: hypothetical protein NPIRA03_38380 [Nitrospirales bacterium]
MSEYVNFLEEVFEQFGFIFPRWIFAGHGLRYKELLFGLVADDMLSLKAAAPKHGIFHKERKFFETQPRFCW